jgi:hypothetical protein
VEGEARELTASMISRAERVAMEEPVVLARLEGVGWRWRDQSHRQERR